MPAYVSRTTATGPAPRRVLAGSQRSVSNAVPRWWCDLSMHVANCARARGPHCPPHARWSVRRRCSVSPRAEFRGALRVWLSQVRDHADAEFIHIPHAALRWLVGWRRDIGFGVSAHSKRRALGAPGYNRCWRPWHGSTSYSGRLCLNAGLTSHPPMVGQCLGNPEFLFEHNCVALNWTVSGWCFWSVSNFSPPSPRSDLTLGVVQSWECVLSSLSSQSLDLLDSCCCT